MTSKKRFFFSIVAGLFCFIFIASNTDVYGKTSFKIKNVKAKYKRRSLSQSFSSGLGGLSSGAGKNWGEIAVQYQSNPKWATEITLIYHVLLKSGKKRVVLTGSFSYLNIQKGPQHFDAIYVHPNILARYGKIQSAAVEIWYQGALQDRKLSSKAGKGEWWNEYKVFTDYLRTVYMTPFILDNPGKYEMLKID